MHTFNNYLVSADYMPSTILDTLDTPMNKEKNSSKSLYLVEIFYQKQTHKI